MKKQKPIVILGPMESESSYLIGKLSQPTEHIIGAYRFVAGSIDSYPVVIGRTYIGMVNAAAAAALAIERFDPLYVIIQGTSGAHDPDLHQGDIVLGERLVHLGRFFTSHRDSSQGVAPMDWQYVGSETVIDGELKEISVLFSDPLIMDTAAAVPYPYGRVIRGTIGAADIWNRELDMIARFRDTLGSDCEEMEGFAIAQVCAQLNIPCADIRVISNSEWHPEEEFDDSYGRYCQEFCLDVIRKLITMIQS